MSEVVSYEVVDGVAVICVNNPPVNALSHAVRSGLSTAAKQFSADESARSAVIVGAGKTFMAGADIKEFGKPLQAPSLPDVINEIEALDKPVVAALHGTPLGGGLEVALGCHYRVALGGTKLGLPEVKLGLMPGAGGTQRLPRVAGSEAAIDIITSGRQVPAPEARSLGIVDAVSDAADARDAGIAFAKQLIVETKPVRRTCDLTVEPVDDTVFDAWAAKVAKKARGEVAQKTAVESVRAALTMPFAEGLKNERRLFMQLMESPQRQGLIHAFFAERSVGKIPEAGGTTPRAIETIGIVGGGTMGTGIGTSALLGGIPVVLIERDEESAARARSTVERFLADSVRRGRLSEEQRDEILAERFSTATEYSALASVDLVVEAVFEDMDVKKDVFKTLDTVCRKGAILATNTSYLDVDQIAAVTSRPQDVIGLHFFSPAHIMKLLEVVVGEKTAPDVVVSGFALAKMLGKTAVRAGICDGFIGNRVLASYKTIADYMVVDGATPYQIDEAVVEFGFPMGPFAVYDLAGLDIGWAARKRRAPTRDLRERYVEFADRICEKGWFGQKTGQGFYIYKEGERRGTPNPEVIEIIEAERATKGITPRSFTNDDIMRRYMAAMVNEAAKVVEEGIALRPLDVDVTLLYGYGFPRWRGGPMKYADMRGLGEIAADIEAFAAEDAHFWQMSPLLKRLAADGGTFEELNTTTV